eukprot:TRINITY_DN3961_c0_g1_i1.p1 TRINITY_DN3961_c0_g1~~TRINITY_DN3961_c0_g1_i1.p1  ORF type:complete len:560 (-),score=222.68 TRINITY_DN3961_c0_g1_i1:24-1703(-)
MEQNNNKMTDVQGPTNVIKLHKNDCPTEWVTAFTDRAEVTRLIKTKVNAGLNEIVIVDLPLAVDRNSVRVTGGQGLATILEVSCSTGFQASGTDPNKSDKEAQIEELKSKKRTIELEVARVEKEYAWIEGFANTVRNPAVGKDGAAPNFFSAGVLGEVGNFLEFYQTRLSQIDEKSEKLKKSLKDINEKIQVVSGSLNPGVRSSQYTEVTVALESKKDSEIAMQLSYVITGAHWNASYDVRVVSGEKTIELTYYGVITNNSTDDWLNTNVILSTAKPSVGGAPPALYTKFVNFNNNYNYRSRASEMSYLNSAPMAQSAMYHAELDDIGGGAPGGGFGSAPMEVMTTSASEGVTSSTFNIPRKCDIASDNKPHKVTIKIIKLDAVFTYETIPRLQAEAFLKASIKNSAEGYPFLPGDLNIFMDGNFVSKSTMNHVNSSETFTIFLGSDSGVKVEHKCLGNFQESSGIFQKVHNKKFKSKIIIKNNKKQPVKIAAYDQLPKSSDASIKVKLIEPVVEEGSKKVKVTEANNLRWKLVIPAGEMREIPFEYSVEWPTNKTINL